MPSVWGCESGVGKALKRIVRFVAPGAPSTRVLDTSLDSPGLMTWHDAATPAQERLPAAPATTQSRQTAASSPTRPASFEVPVFFFLVFFGLESTQLACRVQPERAQVEAKYWRNLKIAQLEGITFLSGVL